MSALTKAFQSVGLLWCAAFVGHLLKHSAGLCLRPSEEEGDGTLMLLSCTFPPARRPKSWVVMNKSGATTIMQRRQSKVVPIATKGQFGKTIGRTRADKPGNSYSFIHLCMALAHSHFFAASLLSMRWSRTSDWWRKLEMRNDSSWSKVVGAWSWEFTFFLSFLSHSLPWKAHKNFTLLGHEG